MNTQTAWQQRISSLASQSEELGTLHPDVLEIAYQENWFKLYVPVVYGGPGKKLPEILRIEEELAYIDGSTAWTVTLCSGAAWFAGFLDPELATDVFAQREVCFAGSGAVGGTAQQADEGYLINGHWKYASGALHATIFTANCILQNAQGEEILDDEGKPVVKSFILKKDEVNILPGWSYFGLVATGSHAFEVENLLIPRNRSFEINSAPQVADEGFDYPFLQLAETTLAVNSLGMGLRFLDLVQSAFYGRSGLRRYNDDQMAFFESEFLEAKSALLATKQVFYGEFDKSWEQLTENQVIEGNQLALVSKLSRELAHQARISVDRMYPYAGLEAAKKETVINRVWRDLHTASQHALLTFK